MTRLRMAALLIASAIMATALATTAFARDFGQWRNADPEISAWYRSLMQPDMPHLSCCGEADAYEADESVIEDGRVIAIITDTRDDGPLMRRHIPAGTRYEVPPGKIVRFRNNPTGHVIIFINTADQVLCYVMNGGV